MIRYVADASVLLATLLHEPGGDAAIPVLMDAAISTVNLAEVHARLVREGVDRAEAWREATALVGRIVDFDAQHAELCGALALPMHRKNVSAGDRACLALGMTLGLPVYTADRDWLTLQVGCEIRAIR